MTVIFIHSLAQSSVFLPVVEDRASKYGVTHIQFSDDVPFFPRSLKHSCRRCWIVKPSPTYSAVVCCSELGVHNHSIQGMAIPTEGERPPEFAKRPRTNNSKILILINFVSLSSIERVQRPYETLRCYNLQVSTTHKRALSIRARLDREVRGCFEGDIKSLRDRDGETYFKRQEKEKAGWVRCKTREEREEKREGGGGLGQESAYPILVIQSQSIAEQSITDENEWALDHGIKYGGKESNIDRHFRRAFSTSPIS